MITIERTPNRGRRLAISGLAAIALLAGACESKAPSAGPTTAAIATPTAALAAPSPASGPSGAPSVAPPATIPQPQPPKGVAVAPDSARVDLAMPLFSHPTEITNPLFPVSSQASVLLLGHVDGKPFRTEVTLLPYTRILDWQGQLVETVVSQYAAYLDGRITEVAYDYYAQADDGSVWYFGEDVGDFVDGSMVTTEGTWLTGKDGPAAMIMPGQPNVGDVYRTENVPGFAFEEVTIVEVGKSLDGPLGPLLGGLLVSELHTDGSTEDKVFAPAYGEFSTEGGGDLEALAMAVPADALTGSMPTDLTTISGGALRIYELAGTAGWTKAASEATAVDAAWSALPRTIVPGSLVPLMEDAIARLTSAVEARAATKAQNASIEVARLAFDLQLRYRSVREIDLARSDLWAAQVLVDAARKDTAGVHAGVFALDYLRDRFSASLDESQAVRLNSGLGDMQSAVVDDDLPMIIDAAKALRVLFAEVLSAS